MPLPPRAIRHVISHRGAISAVAITALITSAFTAAAAAFLSVVAVVAVRSDLARDPGSDILIAAPISSGQVSHATALVTRAVTGGAGTRPAGGLPARIGVSLQSGILRLTSTRLETQIISLPGVAGHVTMLSGSCDSSAGSGSVDIAAACLPQAAAKALGLAVGDRVSLRDTVSGAPVHVLITGIFAPVQPGSRFWQLNPIGLAPEHLPSGLETAGPLVASRAAANRVYEVRAAAWLAEPELGEFGTTGLGGLGSELGARLGVLQNNSASLSSVTIITGLPRELTSLSTALVVTRSELLAGLVTLLVIAGATLALAVRLLAARRAAEAALVAARGASRLQIARRGVIDAVIVAVPAAVIGPLAGTRIALLLLRLGLNPAGIRVPALSPAAENVAWLAAAAVTIGSVAVTALPWLRTPPSPVRRRAAQGRQRSVVSAVTSRADLAVVAVAGVAAWQLIRSRGPVSAGLGGSLSADPILLLAPVLALVAGALLTLRLLPLAARLGDRVAARGRGLVVPVAAWQISRRTLRQAGPTLVGVLAVAAAVMALAQRDSWHASAAAQASFAVGADTRVTIPPAAQIPLGQVTGITMAPGVRASTPAVRATISLPNGDLGTLLALDTSAAQDVIPVSAAGPSAALLRTLAAGVPRDGVRLPGEPGALRLTARLAGPRVARPELFVQLIDAAGIGYELPAGVVPADGRPHPETVVIGRGADYPLRVTGFSLQFNSPGVIVRPDSELSLSGGLALASPRAASGTPVRLAAGSRLVSSVLQNPGSQAPAVTSARAGGGGITVTFTQGQRGRFVSVSPTGISMSDRYLGVGKPLPAVVTASFLASAGARLGQRLETQFDGTRVEIAPLAVLPHLPTLTSGSPAVLVDQNALADALQAAGAQPESVSEWWLSTRGHVSLAGLPPGTSTASLARLYHNLLADPLSLASQQALLTLAIAAVLLAIIGMLVNIATSAERVRDVALLDALGMPPRQVARLLGLEQGLTAVAPSAIGLLFGAALSEFIIPAVTLTSRAARPIPPVAVQVPWLLAGVIAVAMAVLPTLAITLALPRRGAGAARTRIEDDS